MSGNVSCDVIRQIGAIKTGKFTQIQLNLISWNNAEPVYDLRKWQQSDDEWLPRKGFTLTFEQLGDLGSIITEYIQNDGADPEEEDNAEENDND